MPRNRVLSFMSQWGGSSPTPEATAEKATPSPAPLQANHLRKAPPPDIDIAASQTPTQNVDGAMQDSPDSPSTPSRARGDSRVKRMSMMQTYNPPQMEVANDTPPELQPIFTYLNSHSNKLYQEGYFLKLHDLDSRGRPSQDRVWTECFAQLIGTVLSLWDAAALDMAGEDAEVVPTFVNLSDASIKMIESLPMNGAQGGNLQNVLSISTAANNRYLLHFNTLSSLTQWTAGIRLAMFEHSSLQEAYTGSLIAGKGRHLNNIKQIMFRMKFSHEDWARVRFGAGTPWQRCWCVISAPDEKELEKAQKAAKKAGPYEKAKLPKGDIKFYDTRKVTKKTKPIASITDAYAAYAIYPQSKPLIEQSTLVKVEGVVSMHSGRQETTEGFVFIMPEAHQAVTGFEIMLRFLFPTYDTFGLYGRPQKLIADTLDQRGLMFAMPTSRRYGHLDILDVSGLIHTKGSQAWSERQWRRELKKLTADRLMSRADGTFRNSSEESRRRNTASNRAAVRFGNGDTAQSTPGSRSISPSQPPDDENTPPRTDSAPPNAMNNSWSPHKRSTSEAQGYKRYMTETPSRLSQDVTRPDSADGPPPPPPPQHGGAYTAYAAPTMGRSFGPGSLERINSEAEVPTQSTIGDMQEQEMAASPPTAPPPAPPHLSPVEPVGPPPAFTHPPNSRPANQPYAPPELRRANSEVDAATLAQMREATSPQAENGMWNGEVQQRPLQQDTVASQSFYTHRGPGVPADRSQGAVDRLQQQYQRDPRQRLSTIPGSPYVGSEASSSPVGSQNNNMPNYPPPPPPPKNGRPAPPVPLHSAQSISRKPVPRTLPDPPVAEQARSPMLSRSLTDLSSSPMSESWEHMIINEAALDQQLSAAERANTLRTMTTDSSEPDYASTVASSPKKSIERPRAGKLKTVGHSDMPTVNVESQEADLRQYGEPVGASDLPNVNFGPTWDYTRTVGSRPTTSMSTGPSEMADKRRSRSADRLMEVSRDMGYNSAYGSSQSTPGEIKGHSYFDHSLMTEPTEDRNEVAWRPAPSITLHRSQTSLTPEEWVHQRAAMAQQPQYAAPRGAIPDHVLQGRASSVQSPQGRKKLTKERPLSRNYSAPRVPSGDWSQASQIPPPPRPSSRGAGINLDSAGRSLSATEQMQVSRATGSPLVNLNQNSSRQPDLQPGLVSAIAQRERDKAASKESRNSQFVQLAIERQAQQMRTEAEAQAQQREYATQQHQQQALGWAQQAYWQNQQQSNLQAQSRPGLQQRRSWQSGMQPMQYNGPSNGQQYGSPVYYQQGEQYQQQGPPMPQQQYGQNYLMQPQQYQQQQHYGRRYPS